MARYEKVFTLTPMLYTEGSPVIIEAGALQKDNVNGNIIAQLKFKSVSAKAIIKALTVKIVPLDISGNPIGDEFEHQYLDLSVKRDENFGSNEPIILSDNTTRAFSVFVTKIVFDDNTDVILEKSEWSAIPEQNIISLDSVENNYFFKKYYFDCPMEAVKYKDLWFCACGEINHESEKSCWNCTNHYNEMLNIDYEELKCEAHYSHACDLLSQKSISSVNSAIIELKKIPEYKDVEAKLSEAENVLSELNKNLSESKKKRKRLIISTATIVCVCIVFSIILKSAIIPSVKYHSAVKMMTNGEYTEAVKEFEFLDDYKDCKDKINECNYLYANDLFSKKDYYNSIKYFEQCSGYKDSAQKVKSAKHEIHETTKNAEIEIIKAAKVGDKVCFGSYEQDDNTSNGKESIEWLVLVKQNNRILVISDKALDKNYYNETYEDVTWETCTLRKWLNNDFINSAFTDEEKASIPTVVVSADKNPKFSTNPGKATKDKVFLLSITEANKYFSSNSARLCKPTYKLAKENYENYNDFHGWWLRSSGAYRGWAAYVTDDGNVIEVGTEVNRFGNSGICSIVKISVRPAMWINIK